VTHDAPSLQTLQVREMNRLGDPTGMKMRQKLLPWFAKEGRRFFWRSRELSPFHILMLEVLLVRTRAQTVECVAGILMQRCPDPQSLAAIRFSTLESILEPLGLSRKRAKALIALGESLLACHEGRVPRRADKLLALPFVGNYVCSAVRCFAFGARVAVVDANVRRVVCRVVGREGWLLTGGPVPEEVCALAHSWVPRRDPRRHAWALIDLGATLCISQPRCRDCPLQQLCTHARGERARMRTGDRSHRDETRSPMPTTPK
jgi:A/G-specific adenine glycosylase